MLPKARSDFQLVAFGDPLYGPVEALPTSRALRFAGEVFSRNNLPRLTASGREVTGMQVWEITFR
jgi:hypothetical protein